MIEQLRNDLPGNLIPAEKLVCCVCACVRVCVRVYLCVFLVSAYFSTTCAWVFNVNTPPVECQKKRHNSYRNIFHACSKLNHNNNNGLSLTMVVALADVRGGHLWRIHRRKGNERWVLINVGAYSLFTLISVPVIRILFYVNCGSSDISILLPSSSSNFV